MWGGCSARPARSVSSRRTRQPPCTQEQATRWLGALARGLQRHGQTIFLIEQLQPSWLPTQRERSVYVLASRLCEGLSFGIITVLIFHRVLQAVLLRGLFFALLFAAVFALIDVLRVESDLFRRGAGRALAGWQAMLIVLAVVPAVALTAEWLGQEEGWINGLFGLAYGPAWASRSALRSLSNDIQPVETTRWSWAAALKGAGRVAVVIAALLIAVQVMPPDQKETFLRILLLSAPVVLLMGTIDGGLKRGVVEMKTIPNQGIRLSGQTAVRIAGVVLLIGASAGLIDTVWVRHDPQGMVDGLILGSLCGLFLALLKGGLEVVRHGILRLLLSRKGYLPRHLVAFLDSAVDELRFLQKVGGGYIFIHRSLLEYFAASGEETEDGTGKAEPATVRVTPG
jgi:eukaryotic-like serine/threonine-protein kinase